MQTINPANINANKNCLIGAIPATLQTKQKNPNSETESVQQHTFLY